MIYTENNSNFPQRVYIPRDREYLGGLAGYQFQRKDLDVHRNGDYYLYPDEGFDGITASTIHVEVPTDAQEAYDQGYSDGYSSGVTEGEETQKAKLEPLTANTNGHYTREDGYSDVYVNVEGGGDYSSGYTDGMAAQKALLTAATFDDNGHYERENGWNSIDVRLNIPSLHTAITQNGRVVYLPPAGAKGFDSVEIDVNVPQSGTGATMTAITATTNGEYYPSQYGVDGFSQVNVDLDTDAIYDQGFDDGEAAQKALLGTLTAVTNGEYTSETGYSAVTVNVPQTGSSASLSSQTFTNNGEYTPQGFDGWSAITINVPTSAGTNIPLTATTVQNYAADNFGTYNFIHTSADTLSRLVIFFPQTGVTHIKAIYQDDNGWDYPTELFHVAQQVDWINSMTIDGGSPIAPSQFYSFGDSNQHEVVFDLRYADSWLSFYGCTALTSVDCSELAYNEAPWCYNCSKLWNVTMKQAEVIPMGAFWNCTNYSFSVEQSFPLLKKIGLNAFTNSSVYWLGEQHLEEIGAMAFENCVNLQDCNLRFVKTVGSNAFAETTFGEARLPSVSGYTVGAFCFYANTALTTVVIQESENGTIYNSAFNGCSSLANFNVQYESVPPVVVDSDGIQTSNPFTGVSATGIITLMSVGQYSQAWRTWAATYLPGWTVQESN